jgi:DNA-binding CsgD family transcriptional regulator
VIDTTVVAEVPVPLTVRPDDRDALRAAVREVHAQSGLEVGFGGLVPPTGRTAVRLDELLGVQTAHLRHLEVRAGAGLGGRVLAERRPASVDDYRDARGITHDYDGPVLAEGLCTVAAVPVLVGGAPRAVLYAASREMGSVGDRVRDAMASAAARMAVELAIRDEVDRRVTLLADTAARADVGASRWEEIRAVHADLRLLAQTTTDELARDRLLTACGRLASLNANPDVAGEDRTVRLSARELDVLALVALGCSNREAATRLALRPETVKSYLGAAMAKLDAHTRLEAVVRARRLGLLP